MLREGVLRMRAFVLSGGGNRGALQAGALKVLLANGILPDLIVGSSVCALHGAFLAAAPTAAQVERLFALWREAGKHKLFGAASPWRILGALFGRDHLADNRRLRAYIAQALPAGVHTFGDLHLPLYVTICHLATHTLYVCGHDPQAPLIDAILSSAAVPGFFPPTHHKGQIFVDGGVVSNLPVRVALAQGATEIWALDLAFSYQDNCALSSTLDIASYAIQRSLYELVLCELERAVCTPGITVHHIALTDYPNLPLGDFSQTEAMLIAGERTAQAYLAHPRPNVIQRPQPADVPPSGPYGARPFHF
jgi:NTE family protein